MPACKNCNRFTAMPFKHSFSTALEQTKNQSWQTSNGSWMVTPTSKITPVLANTTFCSGDCLFSYLFSHDLLSNKTPDLALHFFKRSDEQRQWLGSQQPQLVLHGDEGGPDGSVFNGDAAASSSAAADGESHAPTIFGAEPALYNQLQPERSGELLGVGRPSLTESRSRQGA